MKLGVWLVAGLILAVLTVSCGDSPKTSSGVTPTAQAVPSKATASTGPQLVLPCSLDEYVQITPKLPYDVKVVSDPDGLVSLKGVLMDTCMGQTDAAKRSTTETLGKGVQKWLETTYPQGSTEKSQVEFESKVCREVARIISSDPTLSKVSWVSLATTGTWDMSKLAPPKVTSGTYTPPGCPLPKRGPSA